MFDRKEFNKNLTNAAICQDVYNNSIFNSINKFNPDIYNKVEPIKENKSNNSIDIFKNFAEPRTQLNQRNIIPIAIFNEPNKFENSNFEQQSGFGETIFTKTTKMNKDLRIKEEDKIIYDRKNLSDDNRDCLGQPYLQETKLNNIINPDSMSTPYIPYDKYPKPTSYFNNFINNGKHEILVENICHLNSINRDINKYPNPFNYFIEFNPLQNTLNAFISKSFKNIRYIRIENSVLPNKYFIQKENNNLNPFNNILEIFKKLKSNMVYNNIIIIYTCVEKDIQTDLESELIVNYIYVSDINENYIPCYEYIYNLNTGLYIINKYSVSNVAIDNEKYIFIYLNNIDNIKNNFYYTNNSIDNAFNILYPNIITPNNIYMDANFAEKVYDYSNLGELKQLLINFKNPIGSNLTVNINSLDYNVPNLKKNECICSRDNNFNLVKNYSCLCSYIRHPKYLKFQNDIMLKIGVINTEFETRVFN